MTQTKLKNLDDLRNLQPGNEVKLLVNTGRITINKLNKALYKLKSFWYVYDWEIDPIPITAVLRDKDENRYVFTSGKCASEVKEADVYFVNGKIGFHLNSSNMSPKPTRKKSFKLKNLSDGEITNTTLDTFLEYFI